MLEYRSEYYGTLGFTYIQGLDVDDESAAFFGLQARDGQTTLSIRGRGSLGVENLTVAGQYVEQRNDISNDANAWYGELGWAFQSLPWAPAISYRYSSFSTGYDFLFYGVSQYGTWYQGEVAGNYAGPFNSNADIQHIRLLLAPTPTIELGILLFNFDDTANGSLDGNEIDLYVQWAVNDNLFVSPLIGIYKPDNSLAQGGTQIGDNDANVLAQIIAIINF